jgi:hypothetical protein
MKNMKFTLDNIQYNTEELSVEGQAIVSKLQDIDNKKNKLNIEISDLNILSDFYIQKLRPILLNNKNSEDKKVTLEKD